MSIHLLFQKIGGYSENNIYTEDEPGSWRVYVVLGCTGYAQGDFTVFHRLYDVCNLTVITDKKAVGYYDMFSKVTLE